MTLESLRSQYRGAILDAARYCGAREVRVFGSIARGDARERSDLDLLVDFEERRSLFDLVEFRQKVQDLVGGPVDVATMESLRPALRASVLDEAVPL